MRGLGSSAREFKKGMSEEAVAAPPPAAKPPTT
jgi:Sec-independent protein translocase protein TatA